MSPDLRGYGDTDAPNSISNHTSLSIVGDLVALIDALGEDQGAFHAWYLCLFRPDRVKALINLNITCFQPRNPSKKPTQSLRAAFGDDYYVIRFQVLEIPLFVLLSGRTYIIHPLLIRARGDGSGVCSCRNANVLKKFLTYLNTGPLMIPKHEGLQQILKLPCLIGLRR
ncbi:hypothetical protein Syun_007366 [Stephania yunnanensis]|uniref:Uncharacterized protein n=1 Tax=Stephania yunnanensis TaxID=152371 RepID=A0AAP0L0Y8_9MAGN